MRRLGRGCVVSLPRHVQVPNLICAAQLATLTAVIVAFSDIFCDPSCQQAWGQELLLYKAGSQILCKLCWNTS